jgi:OFA family oxalate/formate antiporter-like MFS transporter
MAEFLARSEKWEVKEVFKTSTWWLQIAAQCGYNIAVTGMLAHFITWGAKDLGFTMGTMVAIYSMVFVLSAVLGRLAAGLISDWSMARFGLSRKPVLYFCAFGVATAVFLCPFVNNIYSLAFVAVILGFSYGSGMPIWPVYLGDLFGVASLPVLFGIGGIFVGSLPALGPILFGFSYDITGSYNTAFVIAASLSLLSGIAIYFIKPPKRKKAAA